MTKFQNDLATGMDVLYEGDFARFVFDMSFGEIYRTARVPPESDVPMTYIEHRIRGIKLT